MAESGLLHLLSFFAGTSFAKSLKEKSSQRVGQQLKIAFFITNLCDDNIILNNIIKKK